MSLSKILYGIADAYWLDKVKKENTLEAEQNDFDQRQENIGTVQGFMNTPDQDQTDQVYSQQQPQEQSFVDSIVQGAPDALLSGSSYQPVQVADASSADIVQPPVYQSPQIADNSGIDEGLVRPADFSATGHNLPAIQDQMPVAQKPINGYQIPLNSDEMVKGNFLDRYTPGQIAEYNERLYGTGQGLTNFANNRRFLTQNDRNLRSNEMLERYKHNTLGAQKPVYKEVGVENDPYRKQLVQVTPEGQAVPIKNAPPLMAYRKPDVTSFTNQNVEESAYQSERGKSNSKRYDSLISSTKKAHSMASQVGSMLNVIKSAGLTTGVLGTPAHIARRLGSMIGFDTNAGEGDYVAMLHKKLTLLARLPGDEGGLPGSLSDKDLQFLIDSSPGLATTTEGIAILKETLDNYAALQMEMLNYVQENGGRYTDKISRELMLNFGKRSILPERFSENREKYLDLKAKKSTKYIYPSTRTRYNNETSQRQRLRKINE